MILPSFHLIIKQCRSYLFRTIVIRQISNIEKQKKNHSKLLLQSSQNNNHIEITTFTHKAQQAAKDSICSLVFVAGIVALGGLCYVILHELYSRETPNGIYKEASKICLENSDVQEALGVPIMVHTTPTIGSIRINNVRAKMFDEKGHRNMTVSFYLTGKERSSVVAVKVEKNISNKFVYNYILVQLDRPWHNQNMIQVHP